VISEVFLARSLLPPALINSCSTIINEAYERLARSASPALPAGEKFVPTASSFTIGAVIGEADFHTIEGAVSSGETSRWLTGQLGDTIICNQNHSWVRRQYAPHRYPPLHAPHGWHQDGALGFDFLSHPDGDYPLNALLQMVTCWITLDPCGVEAPGLELMTEKLARLLPPAELSHGCIRERFPAEQFWRPAMQPGDALLFSGDILHRTHVIPAMTRDRTSIELRFFPARQVPDRLDTSLYRPVHRT
jgi:hypothetical protein